MRNGPNWCKSSCHEVASEFFIANTPDPSHWTLNWCFFVLYYLAAFGPFRCLTKLNAKRADLVQRFVPRSRVLSFRVKQTPLSPLGPKLIFWCVSYYLGTFSTVWLPYKTRCKTAEVVQKFVPWSRVRIFRNECTHPPPLNPKLMFHSVLYYFCAFGTVRLRYKTQCETGQTDAKVRATKSRQNFS